MSAFSSTANWPVAGTGVIDIPGAIHVNDGASHLNGASYMKAPPPAGPGHNSKIRRSSWYTPNKQSFEEAAAANAGSGRNLHRLRVLQAAVFDSRLGLCPIPVKLLVAVMEYGNRETGVAYPGVRTLAEEIYQDLQKLPPEERATALDKAASVIMNMFTLLKQCGYDVSMRRAPVEGAHAVAHHALTYPDREEMLAAIPIHQQWQEQENARKADAKKKAPQPNAAREVSSPNALHEVTDLTRRVRSEGADLTRTTVPDLTRRQEIPEPLSITEPGSLFNLHAGAGAPRGGGADEGFSEGAPDQGGAPPERAPPQAARGTPCKPDPLEADDEAGVELSREARDALAAFNAAAATHSFTPCKTPTDTQAKRLEKRLKGIGGLRRFRRALGALPLDDWLMGRVKPKDGGKPFRLNLDRLLRTEGPMGDVLGRLLGLADEADVTPGGSTDPEITLQKFAESLDGQSVLRQHGPVKGMQILREIVFGDAGGKR